MTDKEMVEELASIICKETSNKGLCEKCDFKKQERFGYVYQCHHFDNAEAIVNADYRKIPKGAVVLTKEAYGELKGRAEEVFNEMTERMKAEVKIAKKMGVVKGSEETARKILTEIQAEIFHYLGVKNIKEADKLSLLDSLITYDLITNKLYELAKQCGVDIGE